MASLKQTTRVKILCETLKKITMGRIKVDWGKNGRQWILKDIHGKFEIKYFKRTKTSRAFLNSNK